MVAACSVAGCDRASARRSQIGNYVQWRTASPEAWPEAEPLGRVESRWREPRWSAGEASPPPCLSFLFEHDLVRKPVATFRDHAASGRGSEGGAASADADLKTRAFRRFASLFVIERDVSGKPLIIPGSSPRASFPDDAVARTVAERREASVVVCKARARTRRENDYAYPPPRKRGGGPREAWWSGLLSLEFGQFRQRPGERILQGKRIRRGILSLSRLCRDSKEIDAPHILRLERPLTH